MEDLLGDSVCAFLGVASLLDFFDLPVSGLFIFVVRRTVFCLEREGVVVLGIF